MFIFSLLQRMYFLVKPCFYFFHGRFLSERETADRNYALGYYMNAHKVKHNKISILVS